MKTLKRALKKIVTSIFIMVSILFIIIGANAMGFFKKEDKKEYRYYTLYNYLGSEPLMAIQTSLALAIKNHPELKDTIINNLVLLPDMTDPKGESYKLDAKTGPAIYFRTLQDMPKNYFNATQVLIGTKNGFEGCEYHKNVNYGMLIKNEKRCLLLDVHSYVQTQPIIFQAIKDALLHPKKYLQEDNYKDWFDYVWQMVRWSNGEDVLSKLPFNSSVESTQLDMKKKYIKAINSKSLFVSEVLGKDERDYLNLYILRFLSNEGKVTHIEYFEPHLTKGE